MKYSRKNKIKSILLIGIFVSLNFPVSNNSKGSIHFATLMFRTTGGGSFLDYGIFLKQYLRDIGIDLEIQVEEWSVFYGTRLSSRNFDLSVIEINYDRFNPHPSIFFSIKGSRNYIFSDKEIPYIDVSEKKLKEMYSAETEEEKQQSYFLWQELMMDKILPCLPLFYPKNYISAWSNLDGYDRKWSLANNMPYLSFNGFHEGQDQIEEFIIRENNFFELNPLLLREDSSKQVAGFLFEPIIQISPNNELLSTGLVYDWEVVNDFKYRFFVRDDVFWNPSFNITERTEGSLPLDISNTPLMTGLKGESSDGTNQKISAKDVVFTLLAYASSTSSEFADQYKWIKEISIDSSNDSIFYIKVDVDPSTEEWEPFDGDYLNLFFRMNIPCLPEFFLNSSDDTIVYTSGNIPVIGLKNIRNTAQWETFSESAFGCGKYLLDYIRKNNVTKLQKNANWHGIGPKEGNNQTLSIERIIIKILPESFTTLEEFKLGKLDLMDVTVFPKERKLMQADPKYNVSTGYLSKMSCLIFNLERPFIGASDNFEYLQEEGKEEYTKALAIRKAICYAIDREEMGAVLHDGEFMIAHSPVVPYFSYYHYDEIIRYVRDIDAAFEWLKAAGYWGQDNHPGSNWGLPLYIGIVAITILSILIVLARKEHRKFKE